ncbi:MAG: SCO family protein [Burkholderiales bacterium]|nr:SCO family protein [Burkholderiales bacterium]
MRKLVLITMVLAAFAGCSSRKQPPKDPLDFVPPHDLSGADYGKNFRMADFDGKIRQLSDFTGRDVVLFFGYTHCPDVCPTTFTDLAQARKMMGQDASKVQVIFVTIDPDRDTDAILKKYVPSFDPSFIGLRGNAAETKKIADEFHAVYRKVQIEDDMRNYAMDHTAGSFVFDPQGHLRLYMKYGEKPAEMKKDLESLLKASSQ